jgi:hypothetical protein
MTLNWMDWGKPWKFLNSGSLIQQWNRATPEYEAEVPVTTLLVSFRQALRNWGKLLILGENGDSRTMWKELDVIYFKVLF